MKNVTESILPAVRGMDVADQAALDKKLCEVDGTANKDKLGANAALATRKGVANAVRVKLNPIGTISRPCRRCLGRPRRSTR